jgi:hypothetical protein
MTLPAELCSFLSITEIDSAELLVTALFKRKFGHVPPDFPRHFVALYSDDSGGLHLAGYSHMRKHGDVYLSGGSCTEGNTIRKFTTERSQLVEANGGIWYQILKYKFAKLANECDAFFGHCGDSRALQVALAAGFQLTEHRHLIVHWHKPLSDERKHKLTESVHEIGAF